MDMPELKEGRKEIKKDKEKKERKIKGKLKE